MSMVVDLEASPSFLAEESSEKHSRSFLGNPQNLYNNGAHNLHILNRTVVSNQGRKFCIQYSTL